MARRRSADGHPTTADYRHDKKRKNIPPAKIAGEGEIPTRGKIKYAYSPHLAPVLRFDPAGRADKVRSAVDKACRGERLDPGEKELLQGVGANWEQPWLEWAGRQEECARGHFVVDPVALHIHERISAQAIIRNAMREHVQRELFADPEQSYAEAVQFYRHDIDWANRLILGDSLEVMSSLVHREGLAGKVQMIYIDPPYGIKFGSNFQPEVGRRDVKDTEDDLTREPEMVRAYRDTWHLGVHSYLKYLRDRVAISHELLSDTGHLFVQIGEDRAAHVREICDAVFGAKCFMNSIAFRKTTGAGSPSGATQALPVNYDYLLWYARNPSSAKVQKLYVLRGTDDDDAYSQVELPDGSAIAASSVREPSDGGRVFRNAPITSQSGVDTTRFPVHINGREFRPNAGVWKTGAVGMPRLLAAERVLVGRSTLGYKRYFDDFPAVTLNSGWDDTASGGSTDRWYVVQTNVKVIQRCMLMTTAPGDLVLDPTCGSGTTAYVAEQWGRRWITIDTSRVAASIARQRLMAARFDLYRPRREISIGGAAADPAAGFVYRTIPHITLRSISQNAAIDAVGAHHQPLLQTKIDAANLALRRVGSDVRTRLRRKLDEKTRAAGKKAVTDADRRRWLLPPDNRDRDVQLAVPMDFGGWYEWEMPFDTDPDWPPALQDAVVAYRKAWRLKMDEVNRCIAANAEEEELVDRPEVVKGVVRVSGPFTVEGVIPGELSGTHDGTRGQLPAELDDDGVSASENAQAYLKGMLDAMRKDGVLFPGNRKRGFSRVDPLFSEVSFDGLHAEAAWEGDEDASVAIAFGPQYGPVTARQVEDLIRASRRYTHLVVAGFSFAPEASALIAENKHPKLQIHMAHIRPDMNPAMKNLLKETPNSQLFTVFGLPQIVVSKPKDGEVTVTLEGVDIYDPVENTVKSTGAAKVAAWFLDSDFDGRCFCVCQAFFPDRDAWDKIAKALGATADAEAFEAFGGTTSLPFRPGKYGHIAVKVIDPRGNEVMTVKKLDA